MRRHRHRRQAEMEAAVVGARKARSEASEESGVQVVLAGPDLMLILPGTGPAVVGVAMAAAMEKEEAMAMEEEAGKDLSEALVALEALEVTAGLVQHLILPGMDREEEEGAMGAEVETVEVVAMDEEAGKALLVVWEVLEAQAGLVLLQILLGTGPEVVVAAAAMEKEAAVETDEEEKKVQSEELVALEALVEMDGQDLITIQHGMDLAAVVEEMAGETEKEVAMEKEGAVETDEEAGKAPLEELVVLEALEEMDGQDLITIQLGMDLAVVEEAMAVATEKEVVVEMDEEEEKDPLEELVVLEVSEEMDGQDLTTTQLGMDLAVAEEAMAAAMEKEGAAETDEEEEKVQLEELVVLEA